MDTVLTVNGREHRLSLDPRVTLLDALREHLGLTGSKKGCDQGQCGACTVLVDGRRVLSCFMLAGAVRRRGHHHRGPGAPRRRAAPDAAGLPRMRRLPVRLLHAGPDHERGRLRARGPRRQRRRDPRIHERQSVPLRRLSEDRRRRPAGRAADARANRGRPDAPVHARARGRRRPPRCSSPPRPAATAPQYLAGGTNLLDLMKLDVMRPRALVDINALRARATARSRPSRTGCASARWCACPRPPSIPAVRRDYPGARRRAAAGRQRRSCATWRASAATSCSAPAATTSATPAGRACNKRNPGSGCAAMEGVNRRLAVLGVSEHCIANYPGDFAVALVALGAEVELLGPGGARAHDAVRGPAPAARRHAAHRDQPATRRADHRLPRARRPLDPALALPEGARPRRPTSSRSPRPPWRSTWRRTARSRRRASAWAALAAKPWRAHEAEAALTGRRWTRPPPRQAAEAAFAGAVTHGENAFKPELGRRTLVRALLEAARDGDLTMDGDVRPHRHAARSASTAAPRSPAARSTPPTSRSANPA